MSPGYAFALGQGVEDKENQFASSTLSNKSRTERFAIDGMLYPSGNMGDEVKGEGVIFIIEYNWFRLHASYWFQIAIRGIKYDIYLFVLLS